MRRMPKLATLLFEAPEDDLAKFMSTPLSSLGSEPAQKLPDDAKALVKKPTGEDDKQITGGTEGGTGDYIAVTDLKASQNEVGKNGSLANVCTGVDATWDGINWGDPKWLIKSMKPGAEITFSNALLGAVTKDGNVVLDGHHRWSQAFMLNPDCKVNVIFAKAPDLTADETLKAVHLAILAKTDQDRTKSASGGNLFTASEADVEGFFDQSKTKLDPKTGKPSDDGVAPYIYAVMKIQGITDPAEGKKAAIARVMDAIVKCSATVVSGAPPRDAMPQADGDSKEPTNPITAAQVMQALNKGEVNYNSPYVKGQGSKNPKGTEIAKESVSSRDAAILERWNRLAGLIKD